MIINDIDFPTKILEAISNNSFVVFAGAGVSVDSPTNLPDFVGLTESIAKLCGETFNKEDDKIDEFLGDLRRNGAEVQKLVAKRLMQGNPQPNEFHFNILNLFNDSASVRVVTTNQDCMFEAAAKKQGWEIPVFDSPAVPYGDDFNGIVHLHGNVNEPKNIVVTDEDFGKAYMLSGYATRFVADMLKRYKVLFVGYSYNDVIVRYLTTSIPSNTFSGAYILCDSYGQKLKRTGITGIVFPENQYHIACSALKKIGHFAKRGILDWKDRIGNLNMYAPPADKETQDEIMEGINNVSVQKVLCGRIKGKDWLMWLDQQDAFASLFDEDKTFDKKEDVWSRWIITNFLSDELINLIIKHNNRVNHRFCEYIITQFNSDNSVEQNSLFETYIILFRKKIQNKHVLVSAMQSTEKRGMLDCMWNIFLDIFHYDIVINNHYSVVDMSLGHSLEYRWKIDVYFFDKIWMNCIAPHLNNYSYKAIELATDTLRNLYYDLQATNIKGNIFELNMFDIEENGLRHHQDKGLYIIFKMMVQAFDIIYRSDESYSISWINQTLKLRLPLLTRIVLFILRENTNFSANDKMEYVIKNCGFHDINIREQVFKLVADIFDDVDEKKRDVVLYKIMSVDTSGMVFEDEQEKIQRISYIQYNWLHWLNDKCKNTDKIEIELNKIKAAFPDFQPRSRPELIMGPMEVKHGVESPISKESLRKMDAKSSYVYIINFKESSFMGPDRYGLLQTLSEVAGEDINWTMGVVDELENDTNWEKTIWEYIFLGLRKSVCKKNELITVLKHLNEDAIKEHTFLVAQFLFDSLNKDDIYYNISDRMRTDLVKLIKVMWNFRQIREIESDDWTFLALNDTTGIITNIMIKIVCLHPVEEGIPTWFTYFVKQTVAISRDIEEFICVTCEYATRLFVRDAKWTKENVLSYLTGDNNDYAKAAWEGLLVGLELYIPFATALLPIFSDNVLMARTLNERFRKEFIYDYVVLLVYIDDNPLENHIGKIIKGSTESDKHHFAISIYIVLQNMESSKRSELWNRWLKEYWELRINNIPEKLCPEELSVMINWVLLLQDEYEEAVDLVLNSGDDELKCNLIISNLKDSDVVKKNPQKTGELLVYLLQHNSSWLDMKEVSVLIQKLHKNGIEKDTIKKLDELIQEI